MLTHTITTAKLQPEIWPLIENGTKRYELRYGDYVRKPDVFQFIHPETREILGYAQILDDVRLNEWTPELLAQLGSISVEQAGRMFEDRYTPVHAYRVVPVGAEQVLGGFAKQTGDDKALNRELVKADKL